MAFWYDSRDNVAVLIEYMVDGEDTHSFGSRDCVLGAIHVMTHPEDYEREWLQYQDARRQYTNVAKREAARRGVALERVRYAAQTWWAICGDDDNRSVFEVPS